jgi:hypothetical protein
VATIGGVKLLMTKDEATRIAANIGKLPELAHGRSSGATA